MSKFVQKKYSKSRINKAGDNVRLKKHTPEDIAVIENWRASHNHILNTFQITLRRRCKGNAVFAQRLKRRSTIFDKLEREAGMNLSRMQDVAGCRLIFENIKALEEYRTSLHKARFNHKRPKTDTDAYNYIKNPKKSGYRGIHDIYEYSAKVSGGEAWNGLLLEIQYRTKFQHAWATAVEIAGSITGNHAKFNRGSKEHIEFFRLTSEIIARAYENSTSCRSRMTNAELVANFIMLEKQIKLLRALSNVSFASPHFKRGKNTILVFTESKKELKVHTFNSFPVAAKKYFELENSHSTSDVVLVRAQSVENIKNAFRNYFSDTREFVKLVNEGVAILKNKNKT